MVTVSLCMIVRNEEHTLGRCLDSVADLVDEINIVDTGSADKTKEVAARYTDRIFDFEWIQDFAAARNFSFSQATKDYIFWLDSDDILLERDREAFARLKESLDPSYDAVLMDYVLARDALGSAQSMTRRNRLLKRTNGYRWVQPVHEYIEVRGHVYQSDIEITHAPVLEKKDKTRNVTILRKAIEQDGGRMTPRFKFYMATELLALGHEEEAEKQFDEYLSGEMDNVENRLLSCATLANLYRSRGESERELAYLFKTFEYDIPRSDYACRIAMWFEEKQDWRKAAFWYELALHLGAPQSHFGLMNKSSWTWVPRVQLAICFGKLGELELAYAHNEKALEYFPEDPTLLDNRRKLAEVIRRKAEAESRP